MKEFKCIITQQCQIARYSTGTDSTVITTTRLNNNEIIIKIIDNNNKSLIMMKKKKTILDFRLVTRNTTFLMLPGKLENADYPLGCPWTGRRRDA